MHAVQFVRLAIPQTSLLLIWPWAFPCAGAELRTKLDSTELSGYVSAAYQWHLGDRSHVTRPLGGNDRSDRFALDVVSLTLARKLEDWPLDFGYAIQFWLGPDGVALGSSPASDFTVKQARVDIKLPLADQFKLRMGVFDTFIGYEAADRPLNAHYTHSWGWAVEPTQHTGLMAQYDFSLIPGESLLRLQALAANSRDPLINAASSSRSGRKTWGLGITLSAPELFETLRQATVSFAYLNGYDKDNDNNTANNTARHERQNFYAAASFRPRERLTVAATLDVLKEAGRGNDSTVVGLYALQELSQTLSLALRGERVADGTGLSLGAESDAWDITTTLSHRLSENLLSRLEYRWTHLDDPGSVRRDSHGVFVNVVYSF